MKGRDLAKIATTQGWVEIRQTGSHHIFKHPTRPDNLTIPWANTGKNVNEGLSKEILGQMRRGQRRVS